MQRPLLLLVACAAVLLLTQVDAREAAPPVDDITASPGAAIGAPVASRKPLQFATTKKDPDDNPIIYVAPICGVVYILVIIGALVYANSVISGAASRNFGEYVPPVDKSLETLETSNVLCTRNWRGPLAGIMLFVFAAFIFGIGTSTPFGEESWIWPYALIPATIGLIIWTLSGSYNAKLDVDKGELIVTATILFGCYSYLCFREAVRNLREAHFELAAIVTRSNNHTRTRLVNMVHISRYEGHTLNSVDGNRVRWETMFGLGNELDNLSNFINRYNGTTQAAAQPGFRDQRAPPTPPAYGYDNGGYGNGGYSSQTPYEEAPGYYPPAAPEKPGPRPFCNSCGARNPPSSQFCSGCGADMRATV